jgi:signal transduction histidine kinase
LKILTGEPSLFKKLLLSISLASISFLTLLTIVVHYSNKELEYNLLEKQIGTEIENIRSVLKNNPEAALPQTASLGIYLESRKSQIPIPEIFNNYHAGIYHDIEVGDTSYHLQIQPFKDDIIYIKYDITQLEESEELLNAILAIAWISLIFMVVILAHLLSRKLADPITRLSDEVSHLVPDQRGVQLSKHYESDEVGKIAQAFDLYLERMDEYVEKQIAFAAMASHELRSPMTIIQTSTELIDCQHDDLATRTQVAKIQRATRGMIELIDALLQVTRDINPNTEARPLKLSFVINDILNMLQADIRSKNIDIKNTLRETHIVKADKTLAAVVCTKLIKNAIKHGSDSGIRVEMQDQKLSIIDSGFGISQDELEHIFDFAYKSHSSQGYGIGLYISKLICDHQGWMLSLSQIPDGGTCASVEFISR